MTWIQTKRAFLSTVAYDPAHDREKDSPFKNIAKNKHTHVLVRARLEEHIRDLEIVVPNLVWQKQDNADYMFRAVIKRADWNRYLRKAASEEIDYYSHFKEVVRDAHPAHLSQAIYSTMMSIWGKYHDLQPKKKWAKKAGKQDQIQTGQSIDEWLASRNLKPFSKSSDKPEKPFWPERTNLLDEVDSLLNEINEKDPPTDSEFIRDDAPDMTTIDEMASDLKTLLEAGVAEETWQTDLELPTDDLSRADDDAFELYVRIQEQDTLPTADDVDRTARQIKDEAAETANQEARK